MFFFYLWQHPYWQYLDGKYFAVCWQYCLINKTIAKLVLSPPVIYFTDHTKAVLLLWIIYVISVLFLLCFRARLLSDALWSPVGKGLTSWLSLVMSNCEVVTFPLESWVMCGA